VDLFSGAAVTPTPDSFIPIMTTSIKVSNSQSLFVTPSLVTGLYTNTAVQTCFWPLPGHECHTTIMLFRNQKASDVRTPRGPSLTAFVIRREPTPLAACTSN